MRVLVSTRYLSATGGVEMQILQMTRELARRGHQIALLFNRDGDLRPEFEQFCHSMTEVPTFEVKKDVRDLIRLVPAVRAALHEKPDAIYVNNSELPFGVLAGLVTRTPVVGHMHGNPYSPEELTGGMLPRVIARASRLITCSESVRNEFVAVGIALAKVTTVYNGVELSNYPPASSVQRVAARKQLGLPDTAFVALFFGRLDPEKGVEVLLEAWRSLNFPLERARLLIVGSLAPAQNAEARLAELKDLAPPGCHWFPTRRDVVTPLHAADVVAVPSMWNEPFGRVVVEGLAAGLPVVASRVGGIPEILNGDLASLLFERGSTRELADLLDSLVGWRDDRPEMRTLAVARAADFTIEKMIDEVERLLLDAVA